LPVSIVPPGARPETGFTGRAAAGTTPPTERRPDLYIGIGTVLLIILIIILIAFVF